MESRFTLPACMLCLLLTDVVMFIQKSTYIAHCVSEEFFLSDKISRDFTLWFAEVGFFFFPPFLESKEIRCLLLYSF